MPGPISGLIPACHTPFSQDGTLNTRAVIEQVRLFVESGLMSVFVGGTTGEFSSLTLEERMQLAERWCRDSGGMLSVVVHVGHNCQAEAIKLAAHARECGATGVAAMAPSYFKPENVQDLIDFCAPIAAQAEPLPFYFYDIPGMTGVRFRMSEFLYRARFQIPTLCGLKYSNADLLELQECVRLEKGAFDVFLGSDECLLAGLCLGIRGAVGSTYNFAAPVYRRLKRAFDRVDLVTARAEQGTAIDMIKILSQFGSLAASKSVMAMLGADCGPVRPPLRDLSLPERQALWEKLSPLDVFPRPLKRPE